MTDQPILIGRRGSLAETGRIVVKFTVARLAMALAFLLLAASAAAQDYKAPQARKVPRIGVLLGPTSPWANALRDGLRERGYVEEQNIAIEWRGVGVKGHAELADELVRLNVDVIVAGNNLQIEAARRATSTIPIVMAIALDPIHSGFVANLARPGGNITGLSLQFPEVARKRVQFLKETVPSFSRIAVLWDPALTGIQSSVRETELAARALGARVQILEARSPGELDSAFATMTREGAQAVVILGKRTPAGTPNTDCRTRDKEPSTDNVPVS